MIRLILSLLLLFACSADAGMQVRRAGLVQSAAFSYADNFSSDTSTNYTKVGTYGMTITGGTVQGSNNFQSGIVYNSTSTGSNNHWVEAKVSRSSAGDETGLYLRSNGTTGYWVKLLSTGVNLVPMNGISAGTPVAMKIGLTITSGTLYKMYCSVSGNSFTGKIDLNGDGDYADTDETFSAVTDNTYSTGGYIGLWLSRGNGGTPTADDFDGGAL